VLPRFLAKSWIGYGILCWLNILVLVLSLTISSPGWLKLQLLYYHHFSVFMVIQWNQIWLGKKVTVWKWSWRIDWKIGGSFQMWNCWGKTNVGSAWNLALKWLCPAAAMQCASTATVTGTWFLKLHFYLLISNIFHHLHVIVEKVRRFNILRPFLVGTQGQHLAHFAEEVWREWIQKTCGFSLAVLMLLTLTPCQRKIYLGSIFI